MRFLILIRHEEKGDGSSDKNRCVIEIMVHHWKLKEISISNVILFKNIKTQKQSPFFETFVVLLSRKNDPQTAAT